MGADETTKVRKESSGQKQVKLSGSSRGETICLPGLHPEWPLSPDEARQATYILRSWSAAHGAHVSVAPVHVTGAFFFTGLHDAPVWDRSRPVAEATERHKPSLVRSSQVGRRGPIGPWQCTEDRVDQ